MKADSFPTTAALLLPFSFFFLMATSGARWDPSSSLLISILSSLIAPYNIAEEGKAGEISRDLGKSVKKFLKLKILKNYLRSIMTQERLNGLALVSIESLIGQARCGAFRARIYNNDSNIYADFATNLRSNCPETGGNGNLAPLDFVTPNTFDINYYRNLVDRRCLLASDQALFNGDSTDSIVQGYVDNPATFESDFAAAMLLKSYLRSTMTQERLSGLAMISIENEILESINYEELINQFAIKNARRASRIIG
ncbi:hypothetical protein LXL04_007274 [Taraxacum kok-saghyz]